MSDSTELSIWIFDWPNLLGGGIGVIGLLFAITSFVMLYKKKVPKFSMKSTNIFSDYSGILPGLLIKYLENPVSNLTVTKVAFWNAGRQTIDGTDVAVADPLRVEVDVDFRILDARLIGTSSDNPKKKQPGHRIVRGSKVCVPQVRFSRQE